MKSTEASKKRSRSLSVSFCRVMSEAMPETRTSEPVAIELGEGAVAHPANGAIGTQHAVGFIEIADGDLA